MILLHNDRGTRRQTCPSVTSSTTYTTENGQGSRMARDRTRTSAVKSRRFTTSDMARPTYYLRKEFLPRGKHSLYPVYQQFNP